MKGSLNYIRFHEVCKPILSGNVEKTDGKGKASFQNFMIQRGPEASYTLKYKVKINKYIDLLSDSFEFYAASEVNEIESLNDSPYISYEFLNKPLSIQPSVKLLDINGAPIVNKTIIAFSWVEPRFINFEGMKNSPTNNKYYELENYLSEPSDENGVANFTSLTIIGSAERLAYIHFYCEGKTALWTDRFDKSSYSIVLPPRALFPVVLNATAFEVEIVDDYDDFTVKEGEKINPRYEIRAKEINKDGLTGGPKEGVMCFAVLYKSNQCQHPKGYINALPNHPMKYIERPIAAKYSNDMDNPTSQNKIIEEYYLTDKAGVAIFEDLRISQSGPSGNYTLQFNCAQEQVVAEHHLEVTTSIEPENIKFAEKIPPQVVVGDPENSADFDMTLLIEVNDEFKNGVPGKYPSKIYANASLPKHQNDIEVIMAEEIPLFTPSQLDGVMTIPLKVIKLTEDINATIILEIDGIEINTTEIEFMVSPSIDLDAITKIEFTKYPDPEKPLVMKENFDVKVQLFNIQGKGITAEKYFYFLDIYFNVFGEVDLPYGFVNKTCDQSPRISGSTVEFRNCHYVRAATGHYDLRVYVTTENNKDNIIFKSGFIKTYITNLIDIIGIQDVVEKDKFKYEDHIPLSNTKYDYNKRLLSPYIADKSVINDTLIMDSPYILVYFVFSYQTNSPLANTEIDMLGVDVNEYPPIMQAMGGPMGRVRNYFEYKFYKGSKTDENGLLFLEVKIKHGGIGRYVVAFDFGNCISIPGGFGTDNPIQSIEIDSEPYNYEKEKYLTGKSFDHKARVRVKVETGKSAEGYVVIAHPVAVSNSLITTDIFPQSFVDLESEENYLAWITVLQDGSYAITNSKGIATFDSLTVWDVTGDEATTKFQFGVGDHYKGMHLVTNTTDENYTFVPSMSFEMVKQPNKFISAYTFINPYPVVRVKSMIKDRPFYLINMRLTEIFNEPINDNDIADATNKYISGAV